ncbi:MAG: serine/threonine protein kinase [Prevotella sp.]|nr:serine/threonine protein kinase [Bacteroides sp.]MCM1366430.1 serine/threonine protein kinase [Prevotella sp.]
MSEGYVNSLKKGAILTGIDYKYLIQSVIGSGTFGITYLALMLDKDGKELGMYACVKEFFMSDINYRSGEEVKIPADSATFKNYLRRFKRESRTVSTIHHPNVVKVIESFDGNGTSYYSMSYIVGGSLDARLKREGRLSEIESIRIILELAKALEYLHGKRILHLDIKPSNILMMDGRIPVLIDFGLAKNLSVGENYENSLYMGLGTPGYAPVEQGVANFTNTFPVTIDIYSLGATFFKMLCGNCPPSSGMLVNSPFPEDELESSGVSAPAIRLVRRAMEPKAEDRYQTMMDFVTDLEYLYNSLKKGTTPLSLPSENINEEVNINVWMGSERNDGFVTINGIHRIPSGSYIEPSTDISQKRIYEGQPVKVKNSNNSRSLRIRNILIAACCFVLLAGTTGILIRQGVFDSKVRITAPAEDENLIEEDYDIELVDKSITYDKSAENNESYQTHVYSKSKKENKSKSIKSSIVSDSTVSKWNDVTRIRQNSVKK